MRYPASFTFLLAEFKKLPGIGEKTALRLAFHLLGAPREKSEALSRALAEFRERIRPCPRCGGLAEEDLCPVCSDPSRATGVLCVVESARDLLAIEGTSQFTGSYHVLMGALSPMQGVGPEALRIRDLLERVGREGIREVIIATDLDVEGEATASYLSTQLKPLGVKVTRIARGLPIGGSLEQADRATLGLALEGRREL